MNNRFKFRVWSVGYNQYMASRLFSLNSDGELCAPYVNMLKATQSLLVIEQCTGHHDNNYELIYEGDIVKVQYTRLDLHKVEREFQGVIKWDGFEFVVRDKRNSYSLLSIWDDCATVIEVIGNIHKNPELMEEQKCQ